ncbi:MAG: hypothetical protein HOK21_17505 [Rhodospirillaceae bacterium]|nr:hypothetical protein [Rhodospirillaceae bacterium]MBT4689669.1 hypothetical protein [Rhodospirillaceae bacterium]MBT5079404.1 hypothetical protein [Rhodospirillaceae bacterium]MBT5525880.1 hypothetical protein [Rhodospirillaceae bacterium]MBT5880252.1 hypothetical protein [Rhodospirillaceae bacterium]
MAVAALTGCQTGPAEISAGIVGATILGGRSAANEIEQTYYLGIFDEREQLPEAVYRVRLHGQASAISATKFASGWLPAQFVDTLGTSVTFDKKGKAPVIGKVGDDVSAKAFKTGRRLILFGPEGFREAPANHRLVVVMGSSPDAFFNAINQSVGTIAAATQGNDRAVSQSELFDALRRLKQEQDDLEVIAGPVRHDLGVTP